jgi:hypothetical protein
MRAVVALGGRAMLALLELLPRYLSSECRMVAQSRLSVIGLIPDFAGFLHRWRWPVPRLRLIHRNRQLIHSALSV